MKKRHADDPSLSGGKTVDTANDPHAKGTVVYDTRNMVIVEETEFSVAHRTIKGVPVEDRIAMVIRGRRNRPPDHAPSAELPREPVEHLNMLSWDAAAHLVVDIQALASRDGSFDKFKALLQEKWEDYEAKGLT